MKKHRIVPTLVKLQKLQNDGVLVMWDSSVRVSKADMIKSGYGKTKMLTGAHGFVVGFEVDPGQFMRMAGKKLRAKDEGLVTADLVQCE